MRKNSIFRLFLMAFCLVSTLKMTAAKPDSIILKAQLDNCSSLDSFALYESDGISLKLVKTIYSPIAGSGEWETRLPVAKQPYILYYGKNNEMQKLKPMLLGTEPMVQLAGGCFDPTTTSVASALNNSYDEARRQNDQFKRESNLITRQFQQTQDANQRAAIEEKLLQSDKAKIKFLDSLKKKQPFLGKILSVDVYTSYQKAPKKVIFKDEIDYFAKQYFQYANLSDPDFNQIPQLTDAFRNYTSVLALPNLKIAVADQNQYIDGLLNQIPTNSRAYKFALSGVVVALLERRNSEALVYFGEKYLKAYGKEDPQVAGAVQDAVNQFKASMVGIEAPNIIQADTMGNPLALSSLRGKVVMIDFWASWCGPCRRDNPHVVGLYQKYKDKGFDIFSVSLDQSRDRWIQAIKDDKLSWSSHVSDLKHWQNAAAQLYGVRSVPSTVLLDKNGVIIARNLRGEALDQKLKEIFGE